MPVKVVTRRHLKSPGRIAGSMVTLTDGAGHASQGILSILGYSRPFLGLFWVIPRDDVKTALKQCLNGRSKSYAKVRSVLHFVFYGLFTKNPHRACSTAIFRTSTLSYIHTFRFYPRSRAIRIFHHYEYMLYSLGIDKFAFFDYG